MDTLNFSRVANPKTDGTRGFVFIHNWSTGFQELIFPSVKAADMWLEKRQAPKK